MSFRVTPELKTKMDEAAERSGRSVTQEIEHRLERDFDPVFPRELRDEALLLGATYRHGGASAILRLMMTLGNPDLDEQRVRWHLMQNTLVHLHPDRPPQLNFGFIPTDDPVDADDATSAEDKKS